MATVTIPDNKYAALQAAAARKHRPVDDLLLEAIDYITSSIDSPPETPLTREEEQRIIREAMKGRIWTEEDIAQLYPWLDEHPLTEVEIDEILANLPVLDPPLSQTVIEMREEEPW